MCVDLMQFSHEFDSGGEELMQPERLSLGHFFARTGCSDGLRYLALSGWDLAGRDENGMDVLSWAARGGDEDCLLLAGEICRAGPPDVWGRTALHHWVDGRKQSEGIGAQILLAMGGDPSMDDNWGLLPMHISQDSGVWAWSIASLWAKGVPTKWRTCMGLPIEVAGKLLGNELLLDWLVKTQGTPRFPLERLDTNFLGVKLSKGIVDVKQKILAETLEQNCVAKKLRIEL